MISRIRVAGHHPAETLPGVRSGRPARIGVLRRRHSGVLPEQGAGRSGGHHRPGDDDADSGHPADVLGRVLDQGGGGLDRVGQRFGPQHAIRPEDLLGPQRQDVDVHCARRTVVGHHDPVERRFQRHQDAGDVLVAHHADDPDQVPEVELRHQCPGEHFGPGRVMGGVDEYRWCTAHPLQATRAAGGREAGPDGVDVELTLGSGAEEGLNRGQRDHRVVGLMFAVQGQEDVGVHPAEALQFQQLATDRDLSAQHREFGVLAGDHRVAPGGLPEQHRQGLRGLTADHRDGVDRHRFTAGNTDDAGLLRGDLTDGGSEVLGVVHADRGEHHDGGVDHVGGVPGSAHSASRRRRCRPGRRRMRRTPSR